MTATCSLCGCPTSWLREEKCFVEDCPHIPPPPPRQPVAPLTTMKLKCAGGCGHSITVPEVPGMEGARFTCEECRNKPPRKPTKLREIPEQKNKPPCPPLANPNWRKKNHTRRPPTAEEMAAARQWVWKRHKSKRAAEAGWLLLNGKTRLHWVRLTAMREIMAEETE